MKTEKKLNAPEKSGIMQKSSPKEVEEQQQSASGRWGAARRVRLPHRAGLPLSSGGGGDAIER